MQGLAVAMAQGLSGARGGFVGIRFSPDERGRGVDGEGLDKALDSDKRIIGVGIGNWFHRAQELKEGFKMDAEEQVVTPYTSQGTQVDSGPFKLYGLDDWGRRISDETGKELAYPPPSNSTSTTLEEVQAEVDAIGQDKFHALAEKKGYLPLEELQRRKAERNKQKREVSRKYVHELARVLAELRAVS